VGLKIAVELEDGSVIAIAAVCHENGVQATEQAFFPIDKSSIAIKRENFKSAEVEHVL
jgi:hypothetical protein